MIKAIDFWLKVAGLYFGTIFICVCVQGEMKVSQFFTTPLYILLCIVMIIVFDFFKKRSEKDVK